MLVREHGQVQIDFSDSSECVPNFLHHTHPARPQDSILPTYILIFDHNNHNHIFYGRYGQINVSPDIIHAS